MKKLLSVLLILCLLCGIAILPAAAEETMTIEVGPMTFEIPAMWDSGWGSFETKPGLWRADFSRDYEYIGGVYVLDYTASGVTLDITDGDEHMDNFAALFAYANSFPADEWSEGHDASAQALDWANRADRYDGVMPDGVPLYVYSFNYYQNIDGVETGPFPQFVCSYYNQGLAFLVEISGPEATQELLFDITASCVVNGTQAASAPAAPASTLPKQTITADSMLFDIPEELVYQKTVEGSVGSYLHHYLCDDYQLMLFTYDYVLNEMDMDLTTGDDQVDHLYCMLRIFFGFDGDTAISYVNASSTISGLTQDGGDTLLVDQGSYAFASHYTDGRGFLVDIEQINDNLSVNRCSELALEIAKTFRFNNAAAAE
ncbi:MAG: hypothetical protein E7333_04350 [Clostridiales bacterium]|nr:hypothetical protein [Clostridiales bacterium]